MRINCEKIKEEGQIVLPLECFTCRGEKNILCGRHCITVVLGYATTTFLQLITIKLVSLEFGKVVRLPHPPPLGLFLVHGFPSGA
jgi:hypothetical protein